MVGVRLGEDASVHLGPSGVGTVTGGPRVPGTAQLGRPGASCGAQAGEVSG